MKEADLFRQYAGEAVRSSCTVTSKYEKQALMGLAYTWALAALASERAFGSSFIRSPRNAQNVVSLAGARARLAPQDTHHVS
jgi:hypothetical protein